ncbi:capsid protein [Mycobacterium sp. 852002-51961_SCH5331710]|nr:capsid protein [Mycobacterium sp. 852002-51961_SCH5331710]
MSLYTAGAAGILTPEQIGALVVRPLIEQSVAAQVSTVVQTGSHDFRVPVVSADPTAAWTAEGQEIAASDPTIGEVVVTPKKLAGLTVVSNELASDSSPAALQIVGEGLVRDLRRKIDSAYWASATPTNGPAGVGVLSGVSTVDAGASFANMDWAAEAASLVEVAHSTLTAFVAHPDTALTLATIKEQTGSNKALLGSDPTQPTARTIAGVPLYTSPEVPANTVWGIATQHSIVVMRQDPTVVVDSSAFFTSDRVAVRATLRVGFAFPHPAALVKVTTS